MKVTINGITYEGTEEEIRRIVENPPHQGGWNRPSEFPNNYPWPDSVPRYPWPNSIPTNPCDDPFWGQRNWDGSPRVTCSVNDVLTDVFGGLK